jgi:hypothetical protein
MKTGMVFFFLMTLLLVRQDFGQSDSSASVKETPPSILIAKGESYLENTVASMIADSLTGYTVRTIPLQDLVNQNRKDFRAVVLFNAVKGNQINSTINKYIKTTENYGTRSNLLICTAYGEKWNGKESVQDAVTTATKTLNPELVASRVLANIRLILQQEQQ